METLQSLDSYFRTEVIEQLAQQLLEHYVFPDVAKRMSDMLHERLQNHEYDHLSSPVDFAAAVTEHLHAAGHDRHIKLRFSEEPLPLFTQSFDSEEMLERTRQVERRRNFGVNRVERLPGNVGVLELNSFHLPYLAGDTIVAAMNVLAHTDALILDLRKNGGGMSEMVAFLLSFFLPQKRIPLSYTYDKEGVCVRTMYTHPYLPGKHYGTKPLYVLTSRRTASAAEAFSMHVKELNRCLLIGETTAGAGNPGDRRRLHDHFSVFIPSWTSRSALTNTNIEGVGVTPDIEVPLDQAFDRAYLEALREIERRIAEETGVPLPFQKEVQSALQALDPSIK